MRKNEVKRVIEQLVRVEFIAEDVLNDIWEELETMASQEEDGCADVTGYNLV